MTLDQLKSLKVGQVVKYTDDVDALNVEYWKVRHINDFLVEMIALNTEGVCLLLKFDEQDIEHTASMLTVDQPLRDKVLEPKKQLERELRLVEAKIRDSEFKIAQISNFRNALLQSDRTSLNESNKISAEWDNLEFLIEQRNELIEKI